MVEEDRSQLRADYISHILTHAEARHSKTSIPFREPSSRNSHERGEAHTLCKSKSSKNANVKG